MTLSRGLDSTWIYLCLYESGWVSFLTYHSLCFYSVHPPFCNCIVASMLFTLYAAITIIIIMFNARVIINCYNTRFLLSFKRVHKWVSIQTLSQACSLASICIPTVLQNVQQIKRNEKQQMEIVRPSAKWMNRSSGHHSFSLSICRYKMHACMHIKYGIIVLFSWFRSCIVWFGMQAGRYTLYCAMPWM